MTTRIEAANEITQGKFARTAAWQGAGARCHWPSTAACPRLRRNPRRCSSTSRANPGLRLEIIKRSDPAPKGFQVQPRRWVVERTFGWLMQARRLARDYETKTTSSEALILLQACRIMLRRLAK